MKIRVMHVGLGPIGAAVARQIASRKGFQIVGAVDIDPLKTGKDVAQVIGAPGRLRVAVTNDIDRTIRATKPDVAVLCTSSSLKAVQRQFEAVLARRVPIVTTTEEAAYPSPANRRLVKQLDAAARKAKVAVLGTGVNPGFAMDALPIALTAVCERVDRIEVWRVQDARVRRLPFQQKIGAGLTAAEFQQKVRAGSVRHVGFTESISMIADAIGWRLERVEDDVAPKMADQTVASELLAVEAGRVCGVIQTGTGWVNGEPRIRLHVLGGEVAVVLRQQVANLADRAVLVVRENLDHQRHAARPVAFVGDFLVRDARFLTRPAADCTLDVLARHVVRLCLRDDGAQARVGPLVAAAVAGSDRQFLDDAREDLAALGIGGTLFMLDRVPLGMA